MPSDYVRRFATFPSAPWTPPTARVAAFLRQLSPSQQALARRALRSALNGQVDWQQVPAVVRYHRDEPKLRSSVLSAPERSQLERAVLTPRERALLACCYVLRRSEVTRLDWRDVDLASGLLFVRRGKGDVAAWTMMTAGGRRAFRRWHVAMGRPTAGPVFPSQWWPDRPITDGQIAAQVRAVLRRLGLYRPWRCAHAFRRTFATEWLRRNPRELRRLQVLMRHRHLATTFLYDFPDATDFRPGLSRLPL